MHIPSQSSVPNTFSTVCHKWSVIGDGGLQFNKLAAEEIHAGDVVISTTGVEGYVYQIVRELEEGEKGVVVGRKFISTVWEDGGVDHQPELLYPSSGKIEFLEQGYYWVCRKCLGSDDEFLTIGFVHDVGECNRKARISFSGDDDDFTVNDEGENNYFCIPLSSVIKAVRYDQ